MKQSAPVMPVMPAPSPEGMIFLIVCIIIVVALLLWWALSDERKRGPVMPLIFLGATISSFLIEPVFDNTLLYWFPTENPLSVYFAYGRTIPWFIPIGYAWFIGGVAYLLHRRFERGVSVKQAMSYFFVLVFIDWFVVSVCEWLDLSAFYGNQPFHFFGSPLWFSFADATGGFVLGAALYALVPHLSGARKLLLLFLPTFIYGGVLGSTTAPVAQALNSGWSETITCLYGSITIGLCCLLVFVISNILASFSQRLCR